MSIFPIKLSEPVITILLVDKTFKKKLKVVKYQGLVLVSKKFVKIY